MRRHDGRRGRMNVSNQEGTQKLDMGSINVMTGILKSKAKILLKFFFIVGIRKSEVISTITW